MTSRSERLAEARKELEDAKDWVSQATERSQLRGRNQVVMYAEAKLRAILAEPSEGEK